LSRTREPNLSANKTQQKGKGKKEKATLVFVAVIANQIGVDTLSEITLSALPPLEPTPH